MTKSQIAGLVAQIYQEHAFDRDGGYGLVEAILRLMAQLGRSDQRALRDYLLERVEEEDQRLWGVALEVLVREGSPESGTRLEGMLSSGNKTQEWVDQVIFGLLRMGYDGTALNIYLPHIQSRLDRNEPVCALLAHLHKVAPSLSLKMSAHFFAKQLSSQRGIATAESCIAVFVYNYPEKDEDSLLKLVGETSLLNREASEKLRHLIIDYLSKPWVVKEWGQEKASRLQSALSSKIQP